MWERLKLNEDLEKLLDGKIEQIVKKHKWDEPVIDERYMLRYGSDKYNAICKGLKGEKWK